EHTQEVFGVGPCLWQLKVAEMLLKGTKTYYNCKFHCESLMLKRNNLVGELTHHT
ncbi:hypothetical protein PAXRUDRAFT_162239, partial [Paxillus rubicundulus Ve08.2h10]